MSYSGSYNENSFHMTPPSPSKAGGLTGLFAQMKKPLAFPKDKIKILLLENCHESGITMLRDEGFDVDAQKMAFTEEQLLERIGELHFLGVRSKTRVTEKVLQAGKKLLGVGCFCIGTDQVNLDAAEKMGIPVFNAPFANTRSVAELVMGEIIMLARRVVDRSNELHAGNWQKVATGSIEIRGKTLGIIGYGHIGTQLSILAESQGMRCIYYDTVPKLTYGGATQMESMEALLGEADFVSLHVPSMKSTENLIDAEQIKVMKPGAFLLNASRGKVVNLEALAAALKSGKVGGAAVDVFPVEPETNGMGFKTPLQGCPNTILTPHVGGSTQEAQAKIGEEVATSIIKVINSGSTIGSVNFPNLELPMSDASHRVLNIHRNVPGVLRDINNIFANLDANIRAQLLGTTNNVGYLIVDLNKEISKEVKGEISQLSSNLKTRILY